MRSHDGSRNDCYHVAGKQHGADISNCRRKRTIFQSCYLCGCTVEKVQERRVLSYLEHISNQFLYQKTGFLLSEQREQLGLSDNFFKECQSKIGKSKRYLSRDFSSGVYDNQWKLVVPRYLSVKNGGIEDDKI